jgi:predicted MFS family arabinose efflux permease
LQYPRPPARRSLIALPWLNFFLADVQTGLGPFVAAYLAASGWNPGKVAYVLTFGGLITVALQTPAGAIVDATQNKQLLLTASTAVLVAGAVFLLGPPTFFSIYTAQFLIAAAGPFLLPTVAAMTLGMVGAAAFDCQFGTNQAYNSAGNVFTAILVAAVSYALGYRAIFALAALLAIPTLATLWTIDPRDIDYGRARGAGDSKDTQRADGIAVLFRDRALLLFLACAFLFHLANAAMLPELGELLAMGKPKVAASFMAACIIVTQMVIALTASRVGAQAAAKGRKPLLLVGFGVLPLRGLLYTLTHVTAVLVAIQILDGVANTIFTIVSVLVIKDRTEGTGHFNLASGALATMVGIGAALSNALGGFLIQRLSFRASFLGLAAVALLAFLLLWLAFPETLAHESESAGRKAPPQRAYLGSP